MKFLPGSSNQSVVLKSIETEHRYRPRIVYQYGDVFSYIHYYDSTMEDRVDLMLEAAEVADIAFNKQFGMYGNQLDP